VRNATVIKVLTLLIALQHIAFLVLEMFLWTSPIGLKVFRQSLQQAEASATLAANQGLYNGFLAAGLLWSLYYPDPMMQRHLGLFFLGCVAVAGVYGGLTVSYRIVLIQALPALVTFALVFFTKTASSVSP
jgi:putative membrane protein